MYGFLAFSLFYIFNPLLNFWPPPPITSVFHVTIIFHVRIYILLLSIFCFSNTAQTSESNNTDFFWYDTHANITIHRLKALQLIHTFLMHLYIFFGTIYCQRIWNNSTPFIQPPLPLHDINFIKFFLLSFFSTILDSPPLSCQIDPSPECL